MIYFPKPVDEIICTCVGDVSQRILPQLTAANPKIQQLSFMFGHPIELKNILASMDKSASQKGLRYPVVMLFPDIVKSKSSVKGGYNDVTLNMIIAMTTDQTFTTAQRINKNFKPILRPIYEALICEIARCGYFHVQSTRQILGCDQEHMFWGKPEGQGGAGNYFNDFIDAIEIKGLKLTQARKGNSFVQNTFMQLIGYFLSQTEAMITVGVVTENTITNTFFTQPVKTIEAEFQTYFIGRDFTQNITTGAITGIAINFYEGELIFAQR